MSAALTTRFNTPLYIYDLTRVRTAYSALTAILPQPSRVYYSLKANPHPDVVSCLIGCGCLGEISSPAELQIALNAGANVTDCLYTGPGKTDEELVFALERGVNLFSVESLAEMARIAAAAEQTSARPACLLRISLPGSAHGGLRMSGGPSQFGIDPVHLNFLGDKTPIDIVGLHFFSASNTRRQEDLVGMLQAAISTATQIQRAFRLNLERLDLGGGFAAPYARLDGFTEYTLEFSDHVRAMLDSAFSEWRSGYPQIFFEAGRFLVAGAGELLTTVVDVKTSRGKKYAILDAGINHLGGMSGLGRIMPNDIEPELISRPTCSLQDEVDLVGNLCSPADVLGRSIKLDLRAGDVIKVPNVGAYGLTASLIGFLSRPIPTEVIIDGDKFVSATALELVRSPRTPLGAE